MGDVYEAVDSQLGGPVALKTLKPSLAGSAVQLERFRREIHNARKVTHPNVCRIFDIGTDDSDGRDRFFLTMELLSGKTLAQVLDAGPLYDTESALPIAAQIADGLQAAHDAGVVHRDLKPANIMLLSPPTGQLAPRAVITDFGIALSDEQGDIRLTQTGELVGTPEYMAPEQADLGPAHPASDVYAFGLILFEMLTGQIPFDILDSPLATVLKRRQELPRPLRQFLPDADPVWEGTIARCLDREPAKRFQHPTEVVTALAKEPPAPPGTPTEGRGGLLGRFARKLGRR